MMLQKRGTTVQPWIVRENGFQGNVKFSPQARHSFYRYSLSRAHTGEHLFEGVAGDLTEALETLNAHIQFLSVQNTALETRGLAARE